MKNSKISQNKKQIEKNVVLHFLKNKFIYLFLAVLGLRCRAGFH